jgi:hypothetical protein
MSVILICTVIRAISRHMPYWIQTVSLNLLDKTILIIIAMLVIPSTPLVASPLVRAAYPIYRGSSQCAFSGRDLDQYSVQVAIPGSAGGTSALPGSQSDLRSRTVLNIAGRS